MRYLKSIGWADYRIKSRHASAAPDGNPARQRPDFVAGVSSRAEREAVAVDGDLGFEIYASVGEGNHGISRAAVRHERSSTSVGISSRAIPP